jgi:hypothetical protein
MLYYIDLEWDENPLVLQVSPPACDPTPPINNNRRPNHASDSDPCCMSGQAVLRVIRMFSPQRCFFASNYPVDVGKGWPADR